MHLEVSMDAYSIEWKGGCTISTDMTIAPKVSFDFTSPCLKLFHNCTIRVGVWKKIRGQVFHSQISAVFFCLGVWGVYVFC